MSIVIPPSSHAVVVVHLSSRLHHAIGMLSVEIVISTSTKSTGWIAIDVVAAAVIIHDVVHTTIHIVVVIVVIPRVVIVVAMGVSHSIHPILVIVPHVGVIILVVVHVIISHGIILIPRHVVVVVTTTPTIITPTIITTTATTIAPELCKGYIPRSQTNPQRSRIHIASLFLSLDLLL